MAEKPIIFSGLMALALLEGRKTQARRVLKPQPKAGPFQGMLTDTNEALFGPSDLIRNLEHIRIHYDVGDRLWVREAHSLHDAFGHHRDDGMRWGPWPGLSTAISPDQKRIAYFKEGFDRAGPPRWRPSTNMPRWASRLTLTVTDVRVQRVQDISEEDAVAEGCSGFYSPSNSEYSSTDGQLPQEEFQELWDSLNAKSGYGWDQNPWVAAYTFTVENRNIDSKGGE